MQPPTLNGPSQSRKSAYPELRKRGALPKSNNALSLSRLRF